MKRTWGKTLATIAVIALPILGYLIYHSMTALPREVVIATGPENGLYRKLSLSLESNLKNAFQATNSICSYNRFTGKLKTFARRKN